MSEKKDSADSANGIAFFSLRVSAAALFNSWQQNEVANKKSDKALVVAKEAVEQAKNATPEYYSINKELSYYDVSYGMLDGPDNSPANMLDIFLVNDSDTPARNIEVLVSASKDAEIRCDTKCESDRACNNKRLILIDTIPANSEIKVEVKEFVDRNEKNPTIARVEKVQNEFGPISADLQKLIRVCQPTPTDAPAPAKAPPPPSNLE